MLSYSSMIFQRFPPAWIVRLHKAPKITCQSIIIVLIDNKQCKAGQWPFKEICSEGQAGIDSTCRELASRISTSRLKMVAELLIAPEVAVQLIIIQGYRRTRLQRLLNKIYFVRFLTSRVSCKVVGQTFSKPSKYAIDWKNQNSSFKLSLLKASPLKVSSRKVSYKKRFLSKNVSY